MSKPYQTNAADVDQVREGKAKAVFNRETELSDMHEVLKLRAGRRVVWRYLNECGVFKTSFTGNSETFYLEGQRNIGLKILADINEASPDSYLVMLKEHREDLRT